jgi:large repetitive protein
MLRARLMTGGAATTVVAVVAALLVFAGAVAPPGGGSAAQAVPGQPGTPSAPTVLYVEDFQNTTSTAALPLVNYTGTSGATYTASPYWLSNMSCNGYVVSYTSTQPPNFCYNDTGQFKLTRDKAWALGQLTGTSPTNRAVSTNSNGNGSQLTPPALITPNQIEFATANQLTLPAQNRFVTFSVDAAATACATFGGGTAFPHPLLRFYLRTDAGVEIPVSTSPIDPCIDAGTTGNRVVVPPGNTSDPNGNVHYGTFAANSSLLLPGNSLGIVMRNEQGQDNGNDHAFDNIRVLDVSPQLDKSFSPTSVPVGGVSTLTLTVTNTSELAAKNGWAFTDNLPTGLVVAPTPNLGGSCTATKTAAAGSSTIAITNGVLAQGQVSCTITVDVTSSTPASSEPSPKVYENCAANISNVVGLNLPNCASVEFFTQPELTIAKTSTATADSRPGDVVEYTVTASNDGTQDYTAANPAVVFDDLSGVLDDATYNSDATASAGATPSFASPLLSWSGPLAAGASVEITYSVTLTAAGDGNARNIAWAPSDPSDPQTPTCDPPADGVDPVTGEPCAATNQPLPRLSIDKSADQTELPAVGDQVTYSIVVTNEGPGVYTDAAPATATDDLSEVLDDATFDDASLSADIGTATRSGDTLSWTGPLAAGQSATITYTVTYTGDGDNQLTNLACVPNDAAAPGFLPCDSVTIPGAGLQQWKTAAASSSPIVAGSTITYTLFFDNDGQAAADVDAIDDLTHVFDDATVTTEPTTASGLTVVRNGSEITVTGSVPAGERYTVTYTVTVLPDADRGDSIASNFLLAPGDTPPAGPECEPTNPVLPDCTTTPITGVAYSKSVEASASPVIEGTELTYTITVVNTGATAVDVNRDDSLADVLDDATLTDDPASDTASVTVDGPTEDILAIRGTLAVGATAQVVYTVTVNPQAERGNSTASNFLVAPGTPPGDCDPATDQCTVTPIQGYTVSKSASAETVVPGDVVTYTVTVKNTGTTAFTDAAPATFADDLTEVLDDAVYNGDVSAGGIVSGNELAWSGPLAVGASTTVTYSVTVNDPRTGDGTLTNAVVPNAPGGDCDPDGACVVETPVSSFTIAKTSDAETAMPGDVITYTVTVTNTGQVDYTDAAPASFSDDLSGVLDDATSNDDVSAGGSITGTTLTWSGAIAAGDTVEVTYSVTVNDPVTGDQDLLNTVTPNAPGGSCVEGECATTTPIASYTVAKSVDAITALPGGVVTYTLTVTNTSDVDYTDAAPATLTDDLSGVLDDAVYNDDATSGATVSGSTLTWSGAVPARDVVVITYSVTIDDPVTGDFVLRNAAVPDGPGGSCADVCETETPIGSFRVVKSTDSTDVIPGDVVEYTISITNTGQVAYTDATPASFADDLSAVLDDATYNGDAASSNGNGVTYSAPTIAWSGALGVGDTVTVTYSVTVNDPATGDQSLENAVVTPPGTGGNCAPGSTDPDCVANVPSGSYSVEKTASPGSALPGDVVTYTVTVTNTGQVAYTADEPATFTDDLSRVLDDASYNDDVSLGGSVSGTTLTWSRPLAVGETVQVTYSVTVDDPITGDFNLRNVVTATTPGGGCGEDGCVTDTPIASYTVEKVSDVDEVVLGGTVTYAVTVTNTGRVDYTDAAPATFEDDMSGVLDDASYNGDATEGATLDGTTLTWSGALGIDASVTVTYSVTVNQPATGDRRLSNVVIPDGPGGGCAVEGGCVVETPIATYEVAKTVSNTRAATGDRLTYTITVTNTGQVAYTDDEPASFTDDLTSALAIATYNDDATGGAVYDRPVLSWQGAVAVGEVVTVTYSVTLREVGEIRNVVVTPDGSGANCAPDSTDPDCVALTTVVPPGLAITGGVAWIGGGVAGILLLAFGAWLIARRRREQQPDIAGQ